jgi:uncharacterized protein YqiB (DUF1249 family)
MLSDDVCRISWRARPRSFVSLMTLYESNFIRLGWLVPDLRRVRGCLTSAVAGEPALEIAVVEQCRYTTSFRMTYLFEEQGSHVREPRLDVRVYHDARLAEACGTGPAPAHPGLRKLAAGAASGRGERWSCNMLLNKWLEYCVDSGHRFAVPAA